MQEALIWWSSQEKRLRSIPQLLLWSIWKWRNCLVFQNGKENKKPVLDKILATIHPSQQRCYYSSLPTRMTDHKIKNKISRNNAVLQMGFPRALFDGASQQGTCACGVYIEMNEEQKISIYWNGGKGMNNKAEAMAFAGLLQLGTFFNI